VLFVITAHRTRSSWGSRGFALVAIAVLVFLVAALRANDVRTRGEGFANADLEASLQNPTPAATASPSVTSETPLADGGPPHVRLAAAMFGDARVSEPMTATLSWSLPTSAFGDVQGVHSDIAVTVTLALPNDYSVLSMSPSCDVCDDRTRGERRYEWAVITDEFVTNTLEVGLIPLAAAGVGESLYFRVVEATQARLGELTGFRVTASDSASPGLIERRYE